MNRHLRLSKIAGILQLSLLLAMFISSSLEIKASPAGSPTGNDQVSGLRPGAMLIIPRMVESSRLEMVDKSNGLLVYQVDSKSGYWFYEGGKWSPIAGEALTVVKAGAAAGTPWILRTQAGKDISVQAPASKLGTVTEISSGARR